MHCKSFSLLFDGLELCLICLFYSVSLKLSSFLYLDLEGPVGDGVDADGLAAEEEGEVVAVLAGVDVHVLAGVGTADDGLLGAAGAGHGEGVGQTLVLVGELGDTDLKRWRSKE